MPKKLSTGAITNELKGSAWFRRPEAATPPSVPSVIVKGPTKPQPPVHDVQVTVPVNRTKGSTVQIVPPYKEFERTKCSNVQQANKTRIKRRAYDLYESQLSGLRRIRATRELTRDANVSLSELVREAVDLLLEKEGIQ